ncbi:hypothetical protein TGMAS_234310A, partial [Toxoplasma gondii MAS]
MSGRGRGRGGSRGRGKPRGGRGARRVATFEEVMERNAMLERRETREEEASSEEEEEDEEEEEEPTKFKRPLDFLRQRMKEDGDDSEDVRPPSNARNDETAHRSTQTPQQTEVSCLSHACSFQNASAEQ